MASTEVQLRSRGSANYLTRNQRKHSKVNGIASPVAMFLRRKPALVKRSGAEKEQMPEINARDNEMR